VRVELDIDGCALAPHVETAIYRIAQEALQNVQKHAVASVVRVRLRCRGSESELGRGFDLGRGFELTITDDGIGFDTGAAAKATSYGIAGMHERTLLLGARLDLRSIPGRGTIVRVVLAPYDDL
jgi:signal transduction histidine kinase